MHRIVDPKGELYKVTKRYLSNNYRKMHHIPMIRNNRELRQYKIKTINVQQHDSREKFSAIFVR